MYGYARDRYVLLWVCVWLIESTLVARKWHNILLQFRDTHIYLNLAVGDSHIDCLFHSTHSIRSKEQRKKKTNRNLFKNSFEIRNQLER